MFLASTIEAQKKQDNNNSSFKILVFMDWNNWICDYLHLRLGNKMAIT